MGLNINAFPRYIYQQDSQPTGAVNGAIWVDTNASPITTYVYDGSSWNSLTTDVDWLADTQLEQGINILINSVAASSTLNDWEDMFIDKFTDANGTSNTIDINNTTAQFDTNNYTNGSIVIDDWEDGDYTSNPIWSPTIAGNIAVVNDSHVGIKSVALTSNSANNSITSLEIAHTFVTNKYKTLFKVNNLAQNYNRSISFSTTSTRLDNLGLSTTNSVIPSYYINGSSTTTGYALTVDTWYYFNMTIDTSAKTVAYEITNTAGTVLWNLGATAYTTTPSKIILANDGGAAGGTTIMNVDIILQDIPINRLIQTNAITITANPTGHQVFTHNSLAGSGAITYDISFDNGVTFVTGQALNSKNTGVHNGTQMILKLNLNGVGAGNTATADDYGVLLYY